MYLDRNELLLLSRGGRVPRASRAPVPLPQRERRQGPGRFVTVVRRLRNRPAGRPALDTHQYLRLEFVIDDERPHTRH